MLEDVGLPTGLSLVRITRELTAKSVPAGLLSAHRVAAEVWGVLRVLEGSVVFVSEASGESRSLGAGESQVIEPEAPHHVEPAADARFVVEFYR